MGTQNGVSLKVFVALQAFERPWLGWVGFSHLFCTPHFSTLGGAPSEMVFQPLRVFKGSLASRAVEESQRLVFG